MFLNNLRSGIESKDYVKRTVQMINHVQIVRHLKWINGQTFILMFIYDCFVFQHMSDTFNF